MAILATDILIKTAMEGALADMRRNEYLLDDCFGGLVDDVLSKAEFGTKELNQAKNFIINNNIPVYLPYRVDSPSTPALLITRSQATEANDRASLADDGEDQAYDPAKAGQPLHRIVPPFTPTFYDAVQGMVTMPSPHTTYQVAAGMFLMAKNGRSYQITQILDDVTFLIAANINEDFTGCYIVPETKTWLAHRENLFFSEGWTITVMASGEPIFAEWLRQLVIYCLSRYREAYLEARGFEISSMQAGPVYLDPSFEGTKVFAAKITLSGTVPATWIKYISPVFAKVEGGIKILEMPKTPEYYMDQVAKQGWSSVNDNIDLLGQDESDSQTIGSADDDYLLGTTDE
jgi:hypothetical protein